MLKVYDKQLNELGILDNAYQVSYSRHVNEIASVSFSLPENDPKNDLCSHFNYIDVHGESGRYYGKYRIMPRRTFKDEQNEQITYECEHVFATLLNGVMFGYQQFSGLSTREVIEGILEQQDDFVLGRCDFDRYFSYAFENENGLLAPILSIPKPFNEPYLFTFDTQSYPWTLNLIRPSDDVAWDMRWGRDIKSFEEVSDTESIVNRIYPLGYGEGVNQLTIEDVNNDVPYVEDTTSINQYGLKEYVWIDKRYESEKTLKSDAESLLDQWKDPKISFSVDSVDLSVKDEFKHLERPFYTVGNIIVGEKTHQARIIGEKIPDLSEEYNVKYDIDNKLDDIADLQTSVERRQQINDAYSQGATNMNIIPFNENCDENYPAIIEFPLPDDMINLNEARLRIKTSEFRGYTRGMKSAGQFTQEQQVQSSTTESNDQVIVSETTEGGGDHYHEMFQTTGSVAPGTGDMVQANAGGKTFYLHPGTPTMDTYYTHTSSGEHTHQLSFTMQGHSHPFSITIPALSIPGHIHNTEYGIWLNDNLPTELIVKIDGQEITFNDLEGEIDITKHLEKDSNGKVTRGWHRIEVIPNDLARIELILQTRFFIQSRVGGKY